MLYVNVQVLGSMCKLGMGTPHLQKPNNMRMISWLQNLIVCGKQNCEFKFWFDYQCYWSFDNWKFIHEWNRFENLWLKILWWHLIWSACLYVTHVRWWKYVLVVHGSWEGCTWIHSFSEGCVWNRFEHLWLKYFFMMTSPMNCMLVRNTCEMMVVCPWST